MCQITQASEVISKCLIIQASERAISMRQITQASERPSLWAQSLLASLSREKLGQKTYFFCSCVSQWDPRANTAPDPRKGLDIFH